MLFPELNLEGMPDLMQYKLDFRIFGDPISHLLDPGSPCLDQLQILEYGSQNTIPDLGTSCAQFFNRQGIRKRS
jgi:hypothetical protein